MKIIIDAYNDEEWLEKSIKSVYKYAEKVYVVDGYNGKQRYINNYSSDRTKMVCRRMLSKGYGKVEYMRANTLGDKKLDWMLRVDGVKMIISGSQVLGTNDLAIKRVIERAEGKGIKEVLFPTIKVFGNLGTVISKGEYELTIHNNDGKGKEIADVSKYDLTYLSTINTVLMKDNNGFSDILMMKQKPDKGLLAKYDTGLDIRRDWHYQFNDDVEYGKLTMPKTNTYKFVTNDADLLVDKSVHDKIMSMKGKDVKAVCEKFGINTRNNNSKVSDYKKRLLKKMVDKENVAKFKSLMKDE